eukprot:EG_transcript_164
MLERYVAGVVAGYLGQYLQDVDAQAVQVSVWKGDVRLRNLHVREDALRAWASPAVVQRGFIGTLTVQIPWRRLTTESVRVQISQLLVVLQPPRAAPWDEGREKEAAYARKVAELLAREAAWRAEAGAAPEADTTSFAARLRRTILANIVVDIRDVRLVFEDFYTNRLEPFRLRAQFAALTCTSTDDQWQPRFLDPQPGAHLYKRVDLEGLVLSMDPVPVGQGSLQALDHAEWVAAMAEEPLADRCLLLPTAAQWRVRLQGPAAFTAAEPRCTVEMLLDVARHRLQRWQYCRLAELLTYLLEFPHIDRFRWCRPSGPAPSAREWWRFALSAVQQLAREALRRRHFEWGAYLRRKVLRRAYTELHTRLQVEARPLPEDVADHRALEEELDLQELLECRREAYRILAPQPTNGPAAAVASAPPPDLPSEEELRRHMPEGQGLAGDAPGFDLGGAAEGPALALTFRMQSGAVELRAAPRTVAVVRFEGLAVTTRWMADRVQHRVQLQSFTVDHSSSTAGTAFPTVVQKAKSASSQDGESPRASLLLVDVEQRLADAALAVTVRMQPLDVFVSAPFFRDLRDFLRRPVDLPDEARLRQGLRELQHRAGRQLRSVIQNRRRVQLDVSIQAPNFIVPQDAECSWLLMVSSGELRLRSAAPSSPTTAAEEPVQQYTVQLVRTEVWVAPAADARAGCRPPNSAVLAPLNVAATLTERLTTNPALPRLRLDVSIPAVGLSVCRHKSFVLSKALVFWFHGGGRDCVWWQGGDRGSRPARVAVVGPTTEGSEVLALGLSRPTQYHAVLEARRLQLYRTLHSVAPAVSVILEERVTVHRRGATLHLVLPQGQSPAVHLWLTFPAAEAGAEWAAALAERGPPEGGGAPPGTLSPFSSPGRRPRADARREPQPPASDAALAGAAAEPSWYEVALCLESLRLECEEDGGARLCAVEARALRCSATLAGAGWRMEARLRELMAAVAPGVDRGHGARPFIASASPQGDLIHVALRSAAAPAPPTLEVRFDALSVVVGSPLASMLELWWDVAQMALQLVPTTFRVHRPAEWASQDELAPDPCRGDEGEQAPLLTVKATMSHLSVLFLEDEEGPGDHTFIRAHVAAADIVFQSFTLHTVTSATLGSVVFEDLRPQAPLPQYEVFLGHRGTTKSTLRLEYTAALPSWAVRHPANAPAVPHTSRGGALYTHFLAVTLSDASLVYTHPLLTSFLDYCGTGHLARLGGLGQRPLYRSGLDVGPPPATDHPTTRSDGSVGQQWLHVDVALADTHVVLPASLRVAAHVAGQVGRLHLRSAMQFASHRASRELHVASVLGVTFLRVTAQSFDGTPLLEGFDLDLSILTGPKRHVLVFPDSHLEVRVAKALRGRLRRADYHLLAAVVRDNFLAPHNPRHTAPEPPLPRSAGQPRPESGSAASTSTPAGAISIVIPRVSLTLLGEAGACHVCELERLEYHHLSYRQPTAKQVYRCGAVAVSYRPSAATAPLPLLAGPALPGGAPVVAVAVVTVPATVMVDVCVERWTLALHLPALRALWQSLRLREPGGGGKPVAGVTEMGGPVAPAGHLVFQLSVAEVEVQAVQWTNACADRLASFVVSQCSVEVESDESSSAWRFASHIRSVRASGVDPAGAEEFDVVAPVHPANRSVLTVELQQGAPNPSPSAGAAAAVGGSPHKPLGPPPRRGEAEVDRLRVVYRRAWAEAMLRWAAEVGEDLRQAEAGWERVPAPPTNSHTPAPLQFQLTVRQPVLHFPMCHAGYRGVTLDFGSISVASHVQRHSSFRRKGPGAARGSLGPWERHTRVVFGGMGIAADRLRGPPDGLLQNMTLEVSVISDLQEDDMDVEGSVEPAAMCLSTDHYHLLLLIFADLPQVRPPAR